MCCTSGTKGRLQGCLHTVPYDMSTTATPFLILQRIFSLIFMMMIMMIMMMMMMIIIIIIIIVSLIFRIVRFTAPPAQKSFGKEHGDSLRRQPRAFRGARSICEL